MENGIVVTGGGDDHDQLTQMVAELAFQNDYLKARFEELRGRLGAGVGDGNSFDGPGGDQQELERLREEIRTLSVEIHAQRESRKAAEDALEHLRVSYSEADAKGLDLSAQLAQAQQKMEQEIKLRDDKYTELDSKFGKLHKRAKQRIQEIQKEKDDLEIHLRDVKEKAEQASAHQLSAQQVLECTLQQVNEARRSMEIEKQQLRSSNTKEWKKITTVAGPLDLQESILKSSSKRE